MSNSSELTFLSLADNGRVLIPAALRERLGLRPNSKLVAEVKGGSLLLTPAAKHYAGLRGYFASRLPAAAGAPCAADELIAERRAEAAAEDAA